MLYHLFWSNTFCSFSCFSKNLLCFQDLSEGSQFIASSRFRNFSGYAFFTDDFLECIFKQDVYVNHAGET